MKSAFHLLLAVAAFLATAPLHAQRSLVRREFEANVRSDEFKVIPAGRHGVLLLSGDARSRSQDQDWEVTLFDTDFNEQWTQGVTIWGTLDLRGWRLTDEHLYIFLGNNLGKYALMDVDFKGRAIRQRNGELRLKGAWGSLVAHGTKVMVPYATTKGIFINTVDMSNGSTSLVPFTSRGRYSLLSLTETEGSEEACLVYNEKVKSDVATRLAWVDYAGKRKAEVQVEYKGEERINTGSGTKISDDVSIVTGTYNNWRRSGVNQGMYFGVIEAGKMKALKYHSFTSFDNFFNYMSQRAQERLERNIQRKKKMGYDLKLHYQLLTHPVQRLGEDFLVLSEAYYAEYETRYRTSYVNGRPVTTTYQVFVGYRYTHAVLACFDKEGNLLWDHCFPIWNILTFNLKRYVRMGLEGKDQVKLVMAYGNAIKSMTIKDGEVKHELSVDYLATLNEGDRVKYSVATGVEHWYEDYYIAYGFSRIKDVDEQGAKRKRFVFYFNKVGK